MKKVIISVLARRLTERTKNMRVSPTTDHRKHMAILLPVISEGFRMIRDFLHLRRGVYDEYTLSLGELLQNESKLRW